MSERKMIYLCLAHMSEDGMEQKYVKEAFDTNWVVPMGPNVNAFEQDLATMANSKTDGSEPLNRKVVCLSAGTAAVHLALIACGVKAGDEVFIREAEEGLVPAPDGEYKTEDGKTIVVVDGRVAEIRDAEAEVAPEETPAEVEELRTENAQLKAENEALKEKVEELSRQSAAKPAHEEVRTTERPAKTGVKGLDRLAELMSRK